MTTGWLRSARSAIRTRVRWLVRSLVLCAAVFAVSLAAAANASAHAALLSTDPAPNAILATAPRHITLTFGEGVGIADDSIRVLGPSGSRVDDGHPQHAEGGDATVRVALRGGLPHGTYTVAWNVVSTDTHPVAGAFVFSVGAPSSRVTAPQTRSPNASAAGVLYSLGRYADYTGYTVLVGGSAFVLLCRPSRQAIGPLRRLLLTGWSAMVLSTLALLVLRGPYTEEQRLGRALDVTLLRNTLGSTGGTFLAVRLLLLLGACPFLLLLAGRFGFPSAVGEEDGRKGRARRLGLFVAVAVTAVGLAVTWSLAEHASVGLQVPLAIPFDVLHLVAMATWLGGLLALLTVLYRTPAGHPADADTARRFSVVALVAVVTLVATGLYQSWRQVGSWDALVTTAYGRWLLLKVYGVLMMLTAAFYSRRWTTGLRAKNPVREREPVMVMAGHFGDERTEDIGDASPSTASGASGASGASDAGPSDTIGSYQRALRRTAGLEAVVGILVLAVTTVLTNTQPARTDAHGVTASQAGPVHVAVPFDTGQADGTGRGTVEITLTPGRPGSNALKAVVLGTHHTVAHVPELDVAFALPARGIGRLKAVLKESGNAWVAQRLQLPAPGTWELSVTVRTTAIDEVTETRTVRIPGDGR
ncbi:copper resistance protein CopC/CopD [Streptomyces sp. NBC_00201]|uniref:copper resistance CopC/CopD family protein n=1 Tax=Streptomyces sp. NBC_00201 TaxID=2975679 RepID=UPI0022502D74|nr:copper resistance protein CopC [Streptomyces sp. NBC_00201]MCX5250605.1 copper resistance protein CopC/CopD [Streptomyces sp. NBC_00201]